MNVSLEQWQALVCVVDQGGYANAAEYLNKSQSAVSYLIQKLESHLAVRVFKLEGRRSVLTSQGQMLYQKAKQLLASATAIEAAARALSDNWQAEINLAVDAVLPKPLLFQALKDFNQAFPLTQVNLFEAVLSGVGDALIKRQAHLAVSGYLLPGFAGEHLMQVPFVAVASKHHALNQSTQPVSFEDLRRHRQLVVSDLGSQKMNAGWLGAEQRWRFSHLNNSIQAAIEGLGYAWYPEPAIERYLAEGSLKKINLAQGSTRMENLYLIYADNEFASPCTKHLGQLLVKLCS